MLFRFGGNCFYSWYSKASTKPGRKVAARRADTSSGLDHQNSRQRPTKTDDHLRRVHAHLSGGPHSGCRVWRTGIKRRWSGQAQKRRGESPQEPRDCRLLRMLPLGSLSQCAPRCRTAASTRLQPGEGAHDSIQSRSRLDEQRLSARKGPIATLSIFEKSSMRLDFSIYLDYNGTTPIDPAVAQLLQLFSAAAAPAAQDRPRETGGQSPSARGCQSSYGQTRVYSFF